ncbi:MAG: major capsid protein [Candidatus Thorarchaeota archaeon]
MAMGKASDFQVYHEQFYGGLYEKLAQNVDIFNAASRNAIRLVTEDMIGDYNKESFFDRVSNLVSRRDTTSVSAAADQKMTQGELVGVKINRKIGPVAQTLDAWEKIGLTGPVAMKEMSFQLGKQIGEEMAHDMVETSIRCAESALSGEAANTYDATGQSTTTMTITHLFNGLKKFGDMASKIIIWIMHSKQYFDLNIQAAADKIYEEAGVVVYGGAPGTAGRPVIVTDADALNIGANSNTNTYQCLGLVENGVVVTDSESKRLVDEIVTGLENLSFRVQGEYAYNINLKGFAWDSTNGGANPNDAALRLASNWDKQYSSAKNLLGIRIVTT